LINLKAKKAPPRPEKSEGGITGTIKKVVAKVTGNDSSAKNRSRRGRRRTPIRSYA